MLILLDTTISPFIVAGRIILPSTSILYSYFTSWKEKDPSRVFLYAELRRTREMLSKIQITTAMLYETMLL